MAMVFSVGVVSAEDVKINVNDLIIEQALEQYDMTNTSDFSASRVQSTSVNGRCASNEFAIQSTTFNSNMIEATTIIPYKVLDDGSLMNSFEYASQRVSPRVTESINKVFVDVTIYTTVYYAKEIAVTHTPYYRHGGIEAKWSSNNSGTHVNNMRLTYFSRGELFAYPDCINNRNSTMLQDGYYVQSLINEYHPQIGKTFIDGNNTMPYDRMVRFMNAILDGMHINYHIEFITNGQVRSYDSSVPIAGK